jgi:hypothetical protein
LVGSCDLIYRQLSRQDFYMTLPQTMTLIEITEPGGPDVLTPVPVKC